MLEKDRALRYSSLHDVLHDLQEFTDSGQAFATCTIAPGEVIVREGDAGGFAFTIISGRVSVSRMVDGSETVIDTLGKGEIVGELSILANQPRTATVSALEPTVIRIMSRQDVEQELEKLSPWVGNIITALTHRFTRLSQRLSSLSSQG
jgi:CRP-like cAMP-binding protein